MKFIPEKIVLAAGLQGKFDEFHDAFMGHPMGIIASDSRHINGGALTADGCDKLTRHLDLCDLFHIPVLNLVDNPGFAVGIEHEINSTIRKGATWMVAAAQSTVPMFSVLMRRSFGVAGNNFATPRSNATMRPCSRNFAIAALTIWRWITPVIWFMSRPVASI